MDVLIVMSGMPEIEGTVIYVPFLAVGRVADQAPLVVRFRVAFQFGATLAAKRTAIIAAAREAKTLYETAHNVTLPAVGQIEILGI